MNVKDFNEIIENNNVVIVKFSSTWCSPCRTMEPIVKSVADKMEGKIKVVTIDVEESPDIATEYRIRNIPTIIYFKDGEIKDKSVGAMPEKELTQRINNLM